MTAFEQAQKWIEERAEPAISGARGHDRTFAVACCLLHGFCLSESEAFPLLAQYSSRCSPPWTEREIRHKISDALRAKSEKPAGYMLRRQSGTPSRRPNKPGPRSQPSAPPVSRTNGAPPKTSGVEPVLPDPNASLPNPLPDGARRLLNEIFRAGEAVRIVRGVPDPSNPGKDRVADAGVCLTREEWIAKLNAAEGHPQSITGLTQEGGAGVYVGINPMREGGTRDADVTAFRHTLIEFDDISIPEQWSLYQSINLPIAALIHSGRASLHAWVKVDAKTRSEFDDRVAFLHQYLSDRGFKPDVKNKNPGRLSRLPDCRRFGARQELLGVDLGAPGWSAWIKSEEDRELSGWTPGDLMEYETKADPNTLLGDHWLFKGGSLMFVGQSGVGKSSLAVQMAVNLGLGRPVFGIKPRRRLKSLFLQAENDKNDMATMFQGIVREGDYDTFTEGFTDIYDGKIIEFVSEPSLSGDAFVEKLRRRIDRFRPDLVWLDPILSFVGDDVSDQKTISWFFRGHLSAMAVTQGFGVVCVHHTGKPSKDPRARAGWTDTDWNYSGFGSSDLTNWARAIITLQSDPEAEEPGCYRLLIGKRGDKAGAQHPDGTPTRTVFLRHSDKGIYWRQCPPPELPASAGGPKEPKKVGRPSKTEQLASSKAAWQAAREIPDEGMTAKALGERMEIAGRAAGITLGLTKCRTDLLDALVKREFIRFDQAREVYVKGEKA